MDVTKLMSIVSLILALSIASERLVEIVKGFWPYLDESKDDPKEEGKRRSILQLMAVASAILTAYLARDYVPTEMASSAKGLGIVGLGLLASGGSGFWNSILSYLIQVKNIKKVDATTKLRSLKG